MLALQTLLLQISTIVKNHRLIKNIKMMCFKFLTKNYYKSFQISHLKPSFIALIATKIHFFVNNNH
jgi:hypothetical protein